MSAVAYCFSFPITAAPPGVRNENPLKAALQVITNTVDQKID